MSKEELLESGGGRYLIVNASIHNGWQQLSEEAQEQFPLSVFATHSDINWIGGQWMNTWSSTRYSPSTSVCHVCILFS